MSMRWCIVALLAWVLWVDQSAYTLPRDESDSTARQVEGATSRWQQLAVTETRAECRELKRARVREARRRDDEEDRRPGAARRRYREQYRYFCSRVDGAVER